MKTKPKWRTREIWWCTAHDHQTDNDGPQLYWSYKDSGGVGESPMSLCTIVAALLVLDREAE